MSLIAQTISSKSSNLSSGGGPKTQICKTLAVLISVATPNPGATPLVLTPPRRRPPLLLPHYPCRPAVHPLLSIPSAAYLIPSRRAAPLPHNHLTTVHPTPLSTSSSPLNPFLTAARLFHAVDILAAGLV